MSNVSISQHKYPLHIAGAARNVYDVSETTFILKCLKVQCVRLVHVWVLFGSFAVVLLTLVNSILDDLKSSSENIHNILKIMSQLLNFWKRS